MLVEVAHTLGQVLGFLSGETIRGTGHVISQERAIGNVTGINLMTSGNVHITVGDREELRIEAEDNLLPYLETNVLDGQLDLRNRVGVWLRPTCPIHFYVTVKSLESLALSGSGLIEAPDLTANHFRARLSGHGDIRLGTLSARRAKMSLSGSGNLHVASSQVEQQDIALSGHGNLRVDRMDAQDVDVRISGSANMTVGAGQIKTQHIVVSGAGDYDTLGVQSDTTEVCISGRGSVNVQVRDRLEARITGAGSVRYSGDPAIEKSVSGVGRVRPISLQRDIHA